VMASATRSSASASCCVKRLATPCSGPRISKERGFRGVFRNGHVAPAPKTCGAPIWFQAAFSMTVPRIVTGIPGRFQHAGTIFQTAASSAVNRHGDCAAWRRPT
jgi:hypothetical protein